MPSLPTVVIIGRRNVGKSALFNRLIEQEKAIVSEVPGTTRDRTEGICVWRGEKLRVVDTGGLDVGDTDTLDREVKKQARFAIKEADLILFLVDARVGPTPGDKMLAKELGHRPSPGDGAPSPGDGHAVLLAANKAETEKWRASAADPAWKRLGFNIPHSISALTGQGVGDLLDTIFSQLKLSFVAPDKAKLCTVTPDLRIAIIGKPNVGKSSLLNKILGEERVIVSPIPHTTREPQDTLFSYQLSAISYQLLLVDTAGIRRKAKIAPGIEQMGVRKTLATIKRSDVVILVLDSTQPIDAQDKHLAQYIEEEGVGVIVAANKWDLLVGKKSLALSCPTKLSFDKSKQHDLLLKQIHFGLPGLTFAPVVFISALTSHGVQKLLPLALQAQENRQRTIPNEELKALLPKLIKHHRPPRSRAGTRHPVIRAVEQTGTAPPTFQVTIGPKQSLHESYLRFIENQLRRYFNFEGTPIKVWVKQERS